MFKIHSVCNAFCLVYIFHVTPHVGVVNDALLVALKRTIYIKYIIYIFLFIDW